MAKVTFCKHCEDNVLYHVSCKHIFMIVYMKHDERALFLLMHCFPTICMRRLEKKGRTHQKVIFWEEYMTTSQPATWGLGEARIDLSVIFSNKETNSPSVIEAMRTLLMVTKSVTFWWQVCLCYSERLLCSAVTTGRR